MTHWARSAVIVALSAVALAQLNTAQINGRVLDPAGAIVAKAHVLLINEETLEIQRTTSDSDGRFDFHQVSPGHYELKVAFTCFTTYSKSFTIKQGQNLSLTAKLAEFSKKCDSVE